MQCSSLSVFTEYGLFGSMVDKSKVTAVRGVVTNFKECSLVYCAVLKYLEFIFVIFKLLQSDFSSKVRIIVFRILSGVFYNYLVELLAKYKFTIYF